MSVENGVMYHPLSGSTEEIWEGFSWPCLFLGCFWYLYKGMWQWAIISFGAAWITMGISWLFFPFFANEQHIENLRKQGYLTKLQWAAKNYDDSDEENTSVNQVSSIADELMKLSKLRDEGVLNDDEFNKQKQKLLS